MAEKDTNNGQTDQIVKVARLRPAEVCQQLNSREQGLTTAEITKRQQQYGKNILEKKSGGISFYQIY